MEYDFNQSTKQSFYFIESVEGVSLGDLVLAYNDGVLVGSRVWGGPYTDIPAMGYDGYLSTAGYCENGDVVTFKVFKQSTGELLDLTAGDTATWIENGLERLGSLSIKDMSIPNGFEVSSIYPNPFNPSTTIAFDVSKTTNLSIAIYDISGRLVETIANESFSPGKHSINWHANGLSSGIYFAKILSSSYSQTHKLMLMK